MHKSWQMHKWTHKYINYVKIKQFKKTPQPKPDLWLYFIQIPKMLLLFIMLSYSIFRNGCTITTIQNHICDLKIHLRGYY